MKYKNNPPLRRGASENCSDTPSSAAERHLGRARIETNAEIFEAKGNPWYGELPPRTPRLSLDGRLRMSRDAHVYSLRTGPAPEKDVSSDISFSTQHCIPISLRLAKERNHLLPSVSASSKLSESSESTLSSPRRVLAVNYAAKARAKKASRLIKC